MNGPIGLHGGGEYVAGDERFLDALLAAARDAARRRAAAGEPGDVVGHASKAPVAEVRVVILPTAAARGRPERAAEMGRVAFAERAAAIGEACVIEVAHVVDEASAQDPDHAERLRSADLIHLPGGDPDVIPTILCDSPALAALETAWRRGAVVAGASAGAMALAEWTWTPKGGNRALGLVRGLAVVPHYDDIRRTAWQQALDDLAPGGIGYLGLDEQTGVISEPGAGGVRSWRVAGPGAAWWFTRGSDEPLVGQDGDLLRLPA
ncbi:MAG TPA: Type 1 glutamine amidotransferase-like domain-containing protein [Candidatus Limnocylindrales bacterium]|nr:Type 1 glutamine amidotransferase-like domain-containing protein [Candidatus Limnocylindrales bacterium]